MAKKSKTVDIDWNTISGNMNIYTNEFETKSKKGTILKHSVSLYTKDSDGEFHTYYLDVRFTKNAEMPDEAGKHTISIDNAFLSCDFYTDKKGNEHVKPVLVITDCSVIE